MATRQEFVDAMLDLYDNHGVYIGTGNGEETEKLTIGQIAKMEKSYGRKSWQDDIRRDLTFIGECYANGYDMSKSRAGDCSGQIVGVLRRLGVIAVNQDYRAKDFQKLAYHVKFSDLQPGDLVFDTEYENAGHIGVYIGDGCTIDCRGRDLGVVKQYLDSYKWKGAGRLDWFEGTIPPLSRNLYYRQDDLMKGEDVRQCQEQLTNKGFTEVGTIDGVFGSKTDSAVRHFQAANDLQIDGIVGPKTWDKLWK